MNAQSQTFAASTPPHRLFGAFMREVAAVASVLLHPRKSIEDGTRVHTLLVEARRIEATDPARAAELRRLAANVF